MLAASLQRNGQFRICMIDYEPADAMPELKMLWPDVVVLEAVNNTLEIIDILHGGDFLPVIIVVYPETDLIEVVLGERCFKSSVDNLVQVIKKYILVMNEI